MNLGAVSTTKYLLGIGILLVVLFTALRPVGAAGLNVIEGFFFWSLQIGILLPLLASTQIVLQKISFFDRLNPWLKTGLTGVTGALLFVPIALLIDYLMKLDDWTSVHSISDALPILMDEISGVVLPVAVTWVGINAPRILKLNFNEPSSSKVVVTNQKNDGNANNGILQLLSKHLGTDIIYIASELHYVRVVTSLGEELVLYNLKDAVEDVSSFIDGVQTHRSYWVARKHITEISNQGSSKIITLTKGYRVPLSRRKASEVKNSLLLNSAKQATA